MFAREGVGQGVTPSQCHREVRNAECGVGNPSDLGRRDGTCRPTLKMRGASEDGTKGPRDRGRGGADEGDGICTPLVPVNPSGPR
jgi:hypothetical protein